MELLLVAIALAGGSAVGYGAKTYTGKQSAGKAEAKAAKILDDAKARAKEENLKSKEEAIKILDEAKSEERDRRTKLDDTEKRLADREKSLDSKFDLLQERTEKLKSSETDIEAIKDELRAMRAKAQTNLEKIAKFSREDARDKLMQMTERDTSADLVAVVEKLRQDARENAEEYAREVMSDAMQRVASDVVAERTITTVPIPSDEIKGRVIGKEGRNIQTLERLTGVDVIVDDTPGVIILSGFDPIRRQVARITLEKLIEDGRIHPARIEEVVEKSQKEVDKIMAQAAEQACRDAGVAGLPPDIMKYLGMLRFRTSYSQNVLHHSVEMANLAAMVAAEIGADVNVSRTAALLHDLGKAVTHEMDGAHHHITGILMEKAGMDPATIHAAVAHHDDIEATTPEALIVRAIDALSAGRPGARGDTVENYAKRMTDLENLANTFSGVNKTYAMSAGREIRVFVTPEKVDDLTAIKMARDIATKIEATLKYPGTIKVNVIRETRAHEYAK